MKTRAEDFPNELWLSIFSYIEANDLFTAFNNLNHRFDQLLASDYLSFYIQLKKPEKRIIQYPTPAHWYDKILRRVVCLRATAENEYGYVPYYLLRNADEFIRLKSLIIPINKHQINIICRILQKLLSLEYFSITCEAEPDLIKTILNISTLRVFQLNVKGFEWFTSYHFTVKSNIETLCINFPLPSDYPFSNFLLDNMPKLKLLEIYYARPNARHTKDVFYKPMINLPELRTIKFRGGCNDLASIFYLRYPMIAPALRELHLDMNCLFMDRDIFQILISSHWSIFQKLEKVYISIEGTQCGMDALEQMKNYLNNVFAKIYEVNNCYKIKWTKGRNDCFAKLIIEKHKEAMR